MIRTVKLLKARIRIRWEFRRILRAFKQVINLGEKVATSGAVIWDEDNNFSKIAIVFLAQNIHRMRSIELLCKEGFAKDSIGLQRAMFENLIDFKYMHQNKHEVQNFIEYDSCLRLRMGNAIINADLKDIDLEKVRERNEQLKKECESKFSFVDRNGQRQKYRRWNRESLEELSKKVGLHGTYTTVWGFFSNFAHASICLANYYVLGIKGESMVIEIGTSPDLIEESMCTAIAFFLDMLSIINDEYNMAFKDEISILSKSIQKNEE